MSGLAYRLAINSDKLFSTDDFILVAEASVVRMSLVTVTVTNASLTCVEDGTGWGDNGTVLDGTESKSFVLQCSFET